MGNEVVFAKVESQWILDWFKWDGLKFEIKIVGEGENELRVVCVHSLASPQVQEIRIDELVKHLNDLLFRKAEKVEAEAKSKGGQKMDEEQKTLGIHVAEKVIISESVGAPRAEDIEFNAVALLKIDMKTGEKVVVRTQLIHPDGAMMTVAPGTIQHVAYTVVNR